MSGTAPTDRRDQSTSLTSQAVPASGLDEGAQERKPCTYLYQKGLTLSNSHARHSKRSQLKRNRLRLK
eukprot:3424591-Amphidinium_carterae.1